MTRAFWDDVTKDVHDPEFARAYADEAIRISAIDSLANAQNDAADTRATHSETDSHADAQQNIELDKAHEGRGDSNGAEHA